MTQMWTTVVAVLLVGSVLSGAQGTKASDASRLENAVNRELIDGDVRGAVDVYRALSKSSDRAVAASALLRLSAAQMRLKNEAEAVAALEAVVTGYADQSEPAAQARTRLAAIRKTVATGPANGVRSERPAYRHLFTFAGEDSVWGNRVSFDGRFVPFTRWTEGALYLRDLQTGADRQLTTKPLLQKIDGYAESAVVSRNSSHVAYSWFEEGLGQQLRVVDVRQPGLPTARVLYSNPDVDWIGPNDWSPDGSLLAVTVVRKDRSIQLATVATSDGRMTTLKTFANWRAFSDAIFSPDGRFLAFDVVPEGTFARDVVVLSVDGRREVPAVTGSSDDLPVGWTPSGGILFVSDRSGSPALWMQRFDGTSAVSPPTILYRDATVFVSAGFTAAGALFAVAPDSTASSLKTFTANLSSGELLSAPTAMPADAGGVNESAEWSADGKQMVYISRQRSIGGQLAPRLVIRSVTTGIERQLRLDAQNIAYPMFSPDGRRLIVVTYRSGRQSAMLLDPATGEVSTIATTVAEERLVGNGGPTTSPSWSQDGKTVYYRRLSETGWRLMAFDVASRTEKEIFASHDPEGSSSLSPDGTKIYYRRLLGPAGAPLGRQNAAFVEHDLVSGTERELHRRFSLGATNLSPDGRFIVTGSVNEGQTHRTILLVSTTDGQTTELLRVDLAARQNIGAGNNNPIVPIGWAPDSRSVLIRRRPLTGPAEVWWAPVDGRQPKLLITGADTARARINADNRTIVFVDRAPSDSPDELWVLENLPLNAVR